jgi:hypothetical protein
MHATDLLQSLGVTPDDLEPASPEAPLSSTGAQRAAAQHPCLRCGQPATFASVLEIPGAGRRWIDRCGPCFLATTPQRAGPPIPLEETLAVLRDAALEAGVQLHVMLEDERHG